MQIYRPAWKIAKHDNVFAISGQNLPGTGEGADARSWSGVLPASGTYLVVLGTTRGGGEYRLLVGIEWSCQARVGSPNAPHLASGSACRQPAERWAGAD